MEGIITALITGGVIGYFVKYFLDLNYMKKIEELNKRRMIYESLAQTLGVFIDGRESNDEIKNNFLGTYSNSWLWASDDVVKNIGYFLDDLVAITRDNTIDQDEIKKKYAECLISMRRDLGFPDTSLETDDYKFIRF